MLAIRLQRIGRKGHPEYRMIVQDSRRTPTSGKVVANLGNYNPHNKTVNINKEKAELFVKNGAQPSPRVAKLLKAEGVKLPDWVKKGTEKTKTIKNPEKLRRNRPAEEVTPEEPAAEDVSEATEAPASEVAEETTPPKEEVVAETTEEAPTTPEAE